jgi:hypothetical protein
VRKGGWVVAVAAVLVLGAVVALPAGVAGLVLFATGAGTGSSIGSCYGSGTAGGGSLTAEQSENLQVIVATTAARGLSTEDAVIAVMTALTESSLINVGHGDAVGPDSRGLFQQRDSWGPLAVRMDPAGATGLFLDALTSPALKVYGTSQLVNTGEGSRNVIAPWLVAQSVQRSAFDDGSNYRRQYERALSLVNSLGATTSPVSDDPWTDQDPSGNVPEQVGTDGDAQTVRCDGGIGLGGDGPGQWGGHENGRIPLDQLASIPWAPTQMLRADAVTALIALNADFRAQFGRDIKITDSYRTYEEQVRVKAEKGWLAATPGTSNHGWALALDLGGGIEMFGTAEHKWMVANASRYGWMHPSWAQVTGSKPEPWHWEFQGGTEA